MNSQMPKVPMRGAIDLGALAAARKAEEESAARAEARAAQGLPSAVFDATDANFQAEVIQRSMSNPVVVDLWAQWCQPCKTLSPILERVIDSYGGAVFLAKVDVDANPGLGQAFQVQSIPAVFLVMKGQALPLFQGALAEPQVRQVVEQVLAVAQQEGLPCPTFADGAGAGTASGDDILDGTSPLAPNGAEDVAEQSGSLADALFDRAAEAIDAGDWDSATAAYKEVLAADAADVDAKAGLLLVGLMRRGGSADADALVRAAMAAPGDVQAQEMAADSLVLNGRYDEGFAVLLAAVRSLEGKDRDRARSRLLELFDVVGSAHPSVSAARTALANALF